MWRIRVPKERGKSLPNSGIFFNQSQLDGQCYFWIMNVYRFDESYFHFVVWEVGFRWNKGFGSILQCRCSHHWFIHSKSTDGYFVSSECEGKFWDETKHASFYGQPRCYISLKINSCHHLHWAYCNSLLRSKWIIWSTSSHGISFISRWNDCPTGL